MITYLTFKSLKKNLNQIKSKQTRKNDFISPRAVSFDLLSGKQPNYMLLNDCLNYNSRNYQPAWSALNSLVNFAYSLSKQTSPKAYFNALDNVYEAFNDCKKYKKEYTAIDIEREYIEFVNNIHIMHRKFIQKSFDDMYEGSLQLKTQKGQLNRINHWFTEMDYYINRVDQDSINLYNRIKSEWSD